MPRCIAKTTTGSRCRCAARAGSDRCANHAAAAAYGRPRNPTPEEEVAFRAEAACDAAEFVAFSQAYYNTLRELYNVAGAEMEDEYVRYRTLGLGEYNKLYERLHKGFHALVRNDNPNRYYSLFVFIERRRQERRKKSVAPVEPATNYCPICDMECVPQDDEGHCSYSCASGGGKTGDWPGADASGNAIIQSSCWGCQTNQPNQLAHMDPGGCLYSEEQ